MYASSSRSFETGGINEILSVRFFTAYRKNNERTLNGYAIPQNGYLLRVLRDVAITTRYAFGNVPVRRVWPVNYDFESCVEWQRLRNTEKTTAKKNLSFYR